MKKKCLTAVLVFAALLACYLFGTGFMKNAAVYVADFAVSEDGSMITLNVGVGVSAGYVRKLAVHQQAGGKLYLDPYYAFGGFNGSLGARSLYTLLLEDDTTVIALWRNENCYEEVLRKNADGAWERVK